MKEDWEIKKIGEVCDIVNGSTPLRTNIDFWQDGDFPWFTIDDIRDQGRKIKNTKQKVTQVALKKLRVLPIETILLCCTASIGEYAITDIELTTNQQFNGLVIKNKKKLFPMFLLYFCSTLKDALLNLSGKATIDFIPISKLKDIEIHLPPIHEQHQIVTILNKTFEKIDEAKSIAEQNLKNAKELFESYLKDVFSDKIAGNKFETLLDLCELIVDCEHKTAPIQESGYPSIRTPNIGKGYLILENVNRVSEQTYNEWTKRALPQANDLILAREAPAGNIAVIPENLKVCLGQRTVLIRPMKNKLVSKFLAYLILSSDVQKQLLSYSTGATVQHINMKDIRAFKIYNLSTLQEQYTIVGKLDELSTEIKKLEVIYKKKTEDLEELKKSILQKAFSGELVTSKEIAV